MFLLKIPRPCAQKSAPTVMPRTAAATPLWHRVSLESHPGPERRSWHAAQGISSRLPAHGINRRADPGPGKVHPRPNPASHSPRSPQALIHTRNRALASGIGGRTGNRVQKVDDKLPSGQWNPAGIACPRALTRSLTGFD